MEQGLSTALTFLSYTCIILFTVLSVFIIILLINANELLKSYTRLSETIQTEIQPTLEEIKKALQGVNGLATSVDKQITSVKNSFSTAYNMAYNAGRKVRGAITTVFGGAFKLLKFVFK